jgi:hypothetical protein
MQEVPQAIANLKDNHCPRCLQPVPDRAARCPGCGQPVQSSSHVLRLVIGFAGMIAIIFLVVLIFQTVRIEDAGKSEAAVENGQKTPEEELFPPVAPDTGSKQAPTPEKKPPLNEK